MAKLKVNIYWKGVWCQAGTEAPEGVPKGFTEGEIKYKEKVSAKTSTKKAKDIEVEEKVVKPKGEDKNAAPKKTSKKKKK